MLVNLHSHLEGRVRPATAAELAIEAGVVEPAGGWAGSIHLDGPADLTTYLAKVASTYPFFRVPDAARRIAREAVEDAAAAGQDYLELRFGPATHADSESGIRDVIEAVVDGMRQGSASTGIPSGAVVAILRHHDPAVNESVARVSASLAGEGVVGFDLAGDELLFPAIAPHVPAFRIARDAGLGITCHAAEAAPGTAALEAVTLLGATRIGHGAHIADDPDALAWIADRGVVVEVCPTSNWYTGAIPTIATHPAPIFRGAGVPLVLGDDNPAQTGSDLPGERIVLVESLGFSAEDLHALDVTSIAAAFVDDRTRSALSRRLSPQLLDPLAQRVEEV
ncbi:adenosine deaminase [Cryobacterium mesophilum]|uniref:adenosine deaminase n=1 Tax=Terrimesophilobacter mesophilus TaxID=433647 RepID=UPI0014258E39|nr:adenosine deaminase [Terrimesophilobacter mesophilus]MBB5633358.1 adenosine deaminase [Terrimesophilobacter mesophilus]